MRVLKIEINNYKSYYNCDEITFTEGINIIVGQNNSGKTALLEVLSMNDKYEYHLNEETKPHTDRNPDAAYRNEEPFNLFIEYTKSDADAALLRYGYGKQILLPLDLFLEIEELGVPLKCAYSEKENCFLTKHIGKNAKLDGIEIDIGFNAIHSGNVPIDNSKSIKYLQSFFNKETNILQINGSKTSICPIYVNRINENGNNIPGITFTDNIIRLATLSRNYEFSQILRRDFIERKIYKFDIHRLVKNQKDSNHSNETLNADCGNLVNVLSSLQSDVIKWKKYKQKVTNIFPFINDISVDDKLGILIYSEQSTRKDLAISLDKCGTGVGQVLAMLYIVLSAATPRILLIDEPNSFLHPYASRQLINVFKENKQHQYIITTHSPEIITTANPNNIILLSLEKGQTKVKRIDRDEKEDMTFLLETIGSRLSDVFGYDKILWVEGETEEICFKMVVEKMLGLNTINTPIVKVRSTGDFEKKQIEVIKYIYKRLSEGNGLIPPAIAFIFDKENRTDAELKEFKDTIINFIDYPLYENYLMDIKAITAILNQYTKGENMGETYDLEKQITEEEVIAFIDKVKENKKYWWKKMPNSNDLKDWTDKIHAANLLEDIFKEFLESKVLYRKTEHSIALTKWLIENNTERLKPLGDILSRFLSKS